jgi:hypothetical protein
LQALLQMPVIRRQSGFARFLDIFLSVVTFNRNTVF